MKGITNINKTKTKSQIVFFLFLALKTPVLITREETGRGVTEWNGKGAFTRENNYVLVTIVNKFEVEDILNMVYSLDPEAFTTVDEGVKVYGNFQKRV